MKKQLLIIGILLILFVSNSNAKTTQICWSEGKEYGTYSGSFDASEYFSGLVYHSEYNTLYIQWSITATSDAGYEDFLGLPGGDSGGSYGSDCLWHDSGIATPWINTNYGTVKGVIYTDKGYSVRSKRATGPFTVTFVVSENILTNYTISGNLNCISQTDLYIKNSDGNYSLININTSSTFYSFNILSNQDYKLSFSDGHEYEFTASGNKVYNYNACKQITFKFKDNCGNMITGTNFQYCIHKNETITCYNNNAPSGNKNLNFGVLPDRLEVWAYSMTGTLYYNISEPVETTYNFINPTISWITDVRVINGSSGDVIPYASVSFSQDCIIGGYPIRYTQTDVNGLCRFDQCELDDYTITVSASGYNSFSHTYTYNGNWNAFISTNTHNIYLAPEDSLNESEEIITGYGTYLYFKDVTGNNTTSIMDTDAHVKMYYKNNNTYGDTFKLKFQKYNVTNGWVDLLNWTVFNGNDGYKQIPKSNYADCNTTYRGYLYNPDHSKFFYDRIAHLWVHNISTIGNVTAWVMFNHKKGDGYIDYREDIEIIAYAYSNYSYMLNISLELYEDEIYKEHTNLTWAEFVNGITFDSGTFLKWFYKWNPSYTYVSGHNYSIVMRGYNYTLLDQDYVNAVDYRKNELTIIVKDQSGANLNNSYIYLEGRGSLSTGYSYYNSYDNLNDGTYRYKAAKSGYSDYGWDTVVLSGEDKIISYVLTSYESNETVVSEKMSDIELSSMFYTIMYFLLIVILICGLKWLCIKCK